MTTIALPRPILPHRPTPALSSLPSSASVKLEAPVPNKHAPICPPGPMPIQDPHTPPPSPGKDQEQDETPASFLFPPDRFPHIDLDTLSLYELNADSVAAALDHVSRQPLPDPCRVFPWLHGLHPKNLVQQAFFTSRRRDLRKTPSCLRGITIVKAGGNLTSSLLKGAIAPQEFLKPAGPCAEFLDVDPKEGFSVRNFHIQAAKSAMTSDVIVYGDDDTDEITTEKLALDIAIAQQRWRVAHQTNGNRIPTYNTFVCTSLFREFEQNHPSIVAIDSAGKPTGNVLDLFHQERKEMYAMTRASEISHNVWMGPTPDPALGEAGNDYDLMMECTDLGRIDAASLKVLVENAGNEASERHATFLEFPSSGSLSPSSWTHADTDRVLETCKWIWHLAHGTGPSFPISSVADADGDAAMAAPDDESCTRTFRPFKILIHCADGYTEVSLLSIAYFAFSTGLPVSDAWLSLHKEKGRNFFAYPQDHQLLETLAPRLLQASPAPAVQALRAAADNHAPKMAAPLKTNEPCWVAAGFDGSLPSRILDYMYLGNLNHANNPALLRAMGITQILSVGETASWSDSDLKEWGEDKVCVVQGVQDNGIDQLTDEFGRCMDFIDRGRRKDTATLVHCRVGVSRSATICIAEVMRALRLSFPRAYCFVRARRLNIVIQPTALFVWELLRFESVAASGRELEWGEISRGVASLNRVYSGAR